MMGTLVTVEVLGRNSEEASAAGEQAINRAFAWFRQVEERCSRFDPQSELMQLCAQATAPVPVSSLLYELVQFALAVADETGGAFDPTVGRTMETHGFNRNYRTGQLLASTRSGGIIPSAAKDPSGAPTRPPNYRDVLLDPAKRTITLLRPLILDLGAAAKGF